MLTRTECTLRAATRVLAPLLDQPLPRPRTEAASALASALASAPDPDLESEVESETKTTTTTKHERKRKRKRQQKRQHKRNPQPNEHNNNDDDDDDLDLELDRPTSSYLHDIPLSHPFRVTHANVKYLRSKLDAEWWRRWERYRSRRRLVGATDRDLEMEVNVRGIGGGCLVGGPG